MYHPSYHYLGQTINKIYTVPEESVFPDNNVIVDDDEPYIMYEKKAKYYAIALVNKKGKVVVLPKGKYSFKLFSFYLTSIKRCCNCSLPYSHRQWQDYCR